MLKLIKNIQQVKEYYRNAPKDQYLADALNDPVKDNIVRFFQGWNVARSVFEFGCNAGMNLYKIKQKYSGIKEFGIDINLDAINLGLHKFKIDIVCADESFLNTMKDNSYDFVLTASVLNHIPEDNIKSIIDNLKRIAKQIVLLVECSEIPKGDYWFSHKYEDFGFKNIRQVLSNKLIPYNFYIWQKEEIKENVALF